MSAGDRRDDLDEIKRRLADNAEQLAVALFGEPSSRTSRELRFGKHGSAKVDIAGPKRGRFKSFEADRGGSLLDAIQFAHDCDLARAIDYARAWLGDERAMPAPKRRKAAVNFDDDEAHKSATAARLFTEAEQVANTPAEKYLRGRAITPTAWPDATVRWHAGPNFGDVPRALREPLRAAAGMVVLAVRDAAEQVIAIQRLFLDSNGRPLLGDDGKKLKLTLGPRHGRAVVFPGDAAGPLLLAEGPETALSVWYATGCETWSTLGSIGSVTLDAVPRERLVVLCRDDDAPDAPSRKGLRDATRKWRDEGRRIGQALPWKHPRGDKSDFNDALQAHGPDYVRARIAAALRQPEPIDTPPPVALPPTVTLAEGTAQLGQIIGEFFDQAQAWNDLPAEQRPTPPAHLANATMGAGKSLIARAYAGELLERDQAAAVSFALPLHRLTAEQSAALKTETGHDAAIWRGMEQPDPERDDGAAMCLQPELSKAAQDAGASMSDICKICPSRNECGYRRQQRRQARVWFFPHQLLFHTKPKAISAPAVKVIDEKFHDAGMAANIRLAASTLEGDVSDVRHAGDRAMLREVRGVLLAALKDAGAAALKDTGAPKKRARITKARLEAAGLTADFAQEAQRIEWSRKPKPKLRGDVPDMVRTLRAIAGRFTRKAPTLWKLVEDLLRGDHDTATSIEIEPDAQLQGGDGRGLLIWMHYRHAVHESWRSPTLLLDGTAKPEIVRRWFPDLHVAHEVHIEAPHQRVTWVRASFAKARLVPSELADERRNKSRQNNLEDLRRYIEVAAARYRRSRRNGPDVLVVVNEDVEDRLKAGRGLPANVAVEHFNNLRGTNDYEHVRAIIAAGRTLPNEETIHRQAERMAGQPLDRNDPLVAATRWSICEAELLQVIARARGIRRTEAAPLDVLLLGDVPLPLKIDQVVSWKQAQPTPLELLAARGVLPDCSPETKGYWPLIVALLPDVFKDVQAAKDAARGSRWDLSMSNLFIDKSHCETGWPPYTARPHGARYAVPVLVDPEQRRDLAVVLELLPRAPQPDATPPPTAEVPPEAPQAAAQAPEPAVAAPDPTPEPGPPDAPAVPVPEVAAEIPVGAAGPKKISGLKSFPSAGISVGQPGFRSETRPEPVVAAPAPDPVPVPPPVPGPWPGGRLGAVERAWALDRIRGAGVRQDDVAQAAGLSRPQITNALHGRFGLSPPAAARLHATLTALPVRQPGLLPP